MTPEQKGYENLIFPLATSIVMSGIYEDDLDNADEIIYTGEGGNYLHGDHRQICDQIWAGGNLALGVSCTGFSLLLSFE